MGYLDLALKQLDDPPESLLHANQVARKTAKLPEHLLTYSRTKGKGLESCNISDVIDNINPILERVVGDNIALIIDVHDDVEEVQMSSIRLESILTNLISNAADAIDGSGIIHVTVDIQNDPQTHDGSLSGDFVRIKVEDTGSGITSEIMPHIFEPLFTTKSKNRGTGLGLSIIHEVVTTVNGGVSVSSDSSGSTFEIFIPQSVSKTNGKIRIETEYQFTKPNTLNHVIVIDDNQLILEIIDTILNNYTRINTYKDTSPVIDNKSILSSVDLIIIDMVIPGMHREQFIREVRDVNPDCPVLMISGYPELEVEVEAIPKSWFLAKPFTPQQLLKRIDTIFTQINK